MQFYDVALAAEQINKVKNLGSDKDEYNELYENSYVWHLLILICFQCIRNGQLGFLQTFYFN